MKPFQTVLFFSKTKSALLFRASRGMFLLFCLITFHVNSFSQEYPIDEHPLVNACGGFFQDSGGSTGDYSANENLQTTICSDRTVGTHIKLTFSRIDLKTTDELCFFDGLDTDAPELACATDFFNGYPFTVQATAANGSGCLTITFKSNANENAPGWEANIDCIPSCQLIQAELVNSQPVSVPLDTGWIDICQGDRIDFTGRGMYPQDGLVYNHSDETAFFEWDFGDGAVAVGPNVSHIYSEPGGYKATLTITDQFGCTNSNFILQRIRVSTNPTFTVGELPNEICLGDTIQLSGGLSDNDTVSTIEISTQEGAFLFRGVRSDSLALPDGNGTSYRTSIRFTDFDPGQVLSNINDLQSICLNMEHSWLHDMEISISCPSGKSVLLQTQEVINEEVYLGIPDDNDGVNPKAGLGLNYCWTPASANGTLTEFANNNNNSSAGAPYFLPTGNFSSFEDLENLLGCPLNGEWTITVTDLWEQDNGWIFSWGIEINPDLYPSLETFSPQIVNFQWQNDPSIIDYTPDIITARPQNAGTANYVFEAMDDFGCVHDTAIQITVLPPNHPDCINCEGQLFKIKETTICEGDSIELEAFIHPNALGSTTFETFPDYQFGRDNHPPANPYRSELFVSNIEPEKISIDNLVSVCLDIESDYTGDLDIFLISPNGVFLELSSDNGGSFDNYSNTCFTVKASTSIKNGEAPFTGDFLPEGDWAELEGSNANGTWQLQLSDDAGFMEFNTLKSWSISFKGETDAEFNWTPAASLSCTSCINPIAFPETSTHYILEKTDPSGCQVFDTIRINLLQSTAPTTLLDYSLPDGKVLLNWTAVPEATSYEVNINGIDWLPASGDLFHIIEGLSSGDNFVARVRAVFKELNCSASPVSRAIQYIICDLQSEIVGGIATTSCANSKDGEVILSTSGGLSPYTYILNDTISQSSNIFSNLAPDNYRVLVRDQFCADTLSFTIDKPPPLQLNFNVENVNCFNENNGQIIVNPSGGVGGYTNYRWSDNISSSNRATNLHAGTYIVTVSDANNCIVSDTVKVNEPSELTISPSPSLVTCFGGNDGIASIKVVGGTPAYTYNWNNNQTGPAAINLGIGIYEVTVTDANACTQEASVEISQPTELEIDLQVQAISCSGAVDAIIEASPKGGVPPYRYRWSNDQTNKLAFNLDNGNYFLTVSDARGCEKIINQTIEDPNPLILSVSASPPSCRGEANGMAQATVIGGVEPYRYFWNDQDSQQTQVATNLQAGTYEVTILDVNDCEQTANVIVNDPPALGASASGIPASCHDRPDGIANIKGQGGSGNFIYRWENGQTSETITDLLPGKYAYTIEDDNSCQFSDTVEVNAPPALLIDTLLQIPPLCNGLANGTLEAKVLGGKAPYTFLWNNTSTANPYIGAAAGNYNVIVTDNNGCQISRTISLEEPDFIEITTQSKDALCFGGDQGNAQAAARGGVPPYAYFWNDPSAQKDSFATKLSEGVYTVQVTDRNGCTNTATASISQPSTPVSAVINQTHIGCFNQRESTVEVIPDGGTGTDYRFMWSTENGVGNTASNLDAATYSVTISDENNCEYIESFDIIELDSIIVDIAGVEPSCQDKEDGRLAITSVSGGIGQGNPMNYTFTWDANPNQNAEFITNLKGDEFYQLTVRDQQGCRSNLSRYLSNPDPIKLSIESTNISCFGAQDGTISIVELISDADPANYIWSANASNASGNSASNLDVGEYAVTVEDTDGCSVASIIRIEQPETISIKEVELISNTCNGDLTGSINITPIGGSGNYQFAWSNGNNSQNLNNITPGTYEVSITDANNCTHIQSFQLANPDLLNAGIVTENTSCFGDKDGSIIISPSGGLPPYEYSIDGKNFNGLSKIIGLSAGIYTAYVKDANGCIWQDDKVIINDPPEFVITLFASNTVLNLGDSIQIIARYKNNSGPIQLSWDTSIPGSFSCANESCGTITSAAQSNVTYEIYAVDEKGCEASNQIQIEVSKVRKVFVPTGFTPNADGINDRLLIHGKENATIKYFKIFDRWGELIFFAEEFKVNDNTIGWDGTFKGKMLNSGVFTWILEVEYIDGEQEVLKGNTTLLR